jgi:hypothetical protein
MSKFVSQNGSDNGRGTIASPFKTLERAVQNNTGPLTITILPTNNPFILSGIKNLNVIFPLTIQGTAPVLVGTFTIQSASIQNGIWTITTINTGQFKVGQLIVYNNINVYILNVLSPNSFNVSYIDSGVPNGTLKVYDYTSIININSPVTINTNDSLTLQNLSIIIPNQTFIPTFLEFSTNKKCFINNTSVINNSNEFYMVNSNCKLYINYTFIQNTIGKFKHFSENVDKTIITNSTLLGNNNADNFIIESNVKMENIFASGISTIFFKNIQNGVFINCDLLKTNKKSFIIDIYCKNVKIQYENSNCICNNAKGNFDLILSTASNVFCNELKCSNVFIDSNSMLQCKDTLECIELYTSVNSTVLASQIFVNSLYLYQSQLTCHNIDVLNGGITIHSSKLYCSGNISSTECYTGANIKITGSSNVFVNGIVNAGFNNPDPQPPTAVPLLLEDSKLIVGGYLSISNGWGLANAAIINSDMTIYGTVYAGGCKAGMGIFANNSNIVIKGNLGVDSNFQNGLKILNSKMVVEGLIIAVNNENDGIHVDNSLLHVYNYIDSSSTRNGCGLYIVNSSNVSIDSEIISKINYSSSFNIFVGYNSFLKIKNVKADNATMSGIAVIDSSTVIIDNNVNIPTINTEYGIIIQNCSKVISKNCSIGGILGDCKVGSNPVASWSDINTKMSIFTSDISTTQTQNCMLLQ